MRLSALKPEPHGPAVVAVEEAVGVAVAVEVEEVARVGPQVGAPRREMHQACVRVDHPVALGELAHDGHRERVGRDDRRALLSAPVHERFDAIDERVAGEIEPVESHPRVVSVVKVSGVSAAAHERVGIPLAPGDPRVGVLEVAHGPRVARRADGVGAVLDDPREDEAASRPIEVGQFMGADSRCVEPLLDGGDPLPEHSPVPPEVRLQRGVRDGVVEEAHLPRGTYRRPFRAAPLRDERVSDQGEVGAPVPGRV